MAEFRREVRVHAPLSDVWEFHSTEQGLLALTPDWMHLEVESVIGPDGEPDPDILETGSELHMSVQPFGVGPRQTWTSVITEREERDGAAWFTDKMEGGPFESWEHTHSFFADGETTLLRDNVEYELPFGALGRAISPLSGIGFVPMFRKRHQKTRQLLESGSWRQNRE